MKLICASFGTQSKEEEDLGAAMGLLAAPSVRSLLIRWAQSSAPGLGAAALLPLLQAVRCPSQTEHHPQLHASCHDCSSYSNCLLLLWSLRLRCQGW